MSQSESFEKMRREYLQKAFDEKDCSEDPFQQFRQWFDEATAKEVDMPNAMVVSTVSIKGEPSSRVVLLKDYDEQGFVFFTNLKSEKAAAIESNSKVALLFHWKPFDRQIHIHGEAEIVSDEMAQKYFKSRPIDSQIAALVSKQSQVVKNRQALESAFDEVKQNYETSGALDKHVDWGGYRVCPSRFEFWQGRENRLHDRLLFVKESASWQRQRLAP